MFNTLILIILVNNNVILAITILNVIIQLGERKLSITIEACWGYEWTCVYCVVLEMGQIVRLFAILTAVAIRFGLVALFLRGVEFKDLILGLLGFDTNFTSDHGGLVSYFI